MKLRNIILVLTLFFIVATSPGLALNQCLECHQDVMDSVQQQPFIHAPVGSEQCTSCHTGEISDNMVLATLDQPQTTTTIIADFDDTAQIHWLAETFSPATEHFALLPGNCADGSLTLEVWSTQREKLQFDIDVPPFNTMATLPQPAEPSLNQIHLHEYNSTLLSRATLSWITTTPCRCRITYGVSGEEYTVGEDDLFTLHHRMVLRNFREQHLFHIDCLDPFGQQLSSTTQKLTSMPLQAHPAAVNSAPLMQQQITTNFHRLGQQIWLALRSPQEISVSIGTTKQLKNGEQDKPETTVALSTTLPEAPGIAVKGGSGRTNQETDEHKGLLTNHAININICYRCHPNMRAGMSHPVDVVAPPGMIIPRDYPLLPDGRMSCMSCHTVHAGVDNYRLRKDSKRELCIGCHVNY